MTYSAPGRIDELDPQRLALWNDRISEIVDRQIVASRRQKRPPSAEAWLYNPISGPLPTGQEAAVRWTAFPKKLSDQSPTMAKAWERGDNNRDNQEEYCEWEVARDPQRGGKIVRVTFTCETEDYYGFLAEHDPDLLLALYRKHVSPSVALSDLIIGGAYEPRNKWNFPQIGNTRGALMHMAQVNNAWEAAVNLGAVALWPRIDDAGRPITGEQELIRCSPFGDAARHSDPHIGAELNALVRAGNEISFADPVGLYIDSIDQSGWETPDGSDPTAWFRIVRGTADHMLRVVFEAPAGSGPAVLADCRIDGRSIQFGGQIADKIQIRITGLARRAANPAPKLHCNGAAEPQPALLGQPLAVSAKSFARLTSPTWVVADE